MPNMDPRYSHKADSWHSFAFCHGNSISMAAKVIYAYILPQRTFVPNMKLKYFHVIELLHNSFVAMVTVETKQTSDTFCPKEHMCLIWT